MITSAQTVHTNAKQQIDRLYQDAIAEMKCAIMSLDDATRKMKDNLERFERSGSMASVHLSIEIMDNLPIFRSMMRMSALYGALKAYNDVDNNIVFGEEN